MIQTLHCSYWNPKRVIFRNLTGGNWAKWLRACATSACRLGMKHMFFFLNPGWWALENKYPMYVEQQFYHFWYIGPMLAHIPQNDFLNISVWRKTQVTTVTRYQKDRIHLHWEMIPPLCQGFVGWSDFHRWNCLENWFGWGFFFDIFFGNSFCSFSGSWQFCWYLTSNFLVPNKTSCQTPRQERPFQRPPCHGCHADTNVLDFVRCRRNSATTWCPSWVAGRGHRRRGPLKTLLP